MASDFLGYMPEDGASSRIAAAAKFGFGLCHLATVVACERQ